MRCPGLVALSKSSSTPRDHPTISIRSHRCSKSSSALGLDLNGSALGLNRAVMGLMVCASISRPQLSVVQGGLPWSAPAVVEVTDAGLWIKGIGILKMGCGPLRASQPSKHYLRTTRNCNSRKVLAHCGSELGRDY